MIKTEDGKIILEPEEYEELVKALEYKKKKEEINRQGQKKYRETHKEEVQERQKEYMREYMKDYMKEYLKQDNVKEAKRQYMRNYMAQKRAADKEKLMMPQVSVI